MNGTLSAAEPSPTEAPYYSSTTTPTPGNLPPSTPSPTPGDSNTNWAAEVQADVSPPALIAPSGNAAAALTGVSTGAASTQGDTPALASAMPADVTAAARVVGSDAVFDTVSTGAPPPPGNPPQLSTGANSSAAPDDVEATGPAGDLSAMQRAAQAVAQSQGARAAPAVATGGVEQFASSSAQASAGSTPAVSRSGSKKRKATKKKKGKK
jgi:hypothetical protein